MNIPSDCVIVEHTSGVWSYHIARKERFGLSLCGKPTMHTGIQTWGVESQNESMTYRWCSKCAGLVKPKDETGLGHRIVAARKRKGWTQRGLSKAAKVSRSSLSEIEAGLTSPRGPTLIKLSHTLGVTIHYLLTGEEFSPGPRDVTVPAALVELAEDEQIPFGELQFLLYLDGRMTMRRTYEPLSKAQWKVRYDRFRELVGQA